MTIAESLRRLDVEHLLFPVLVQLAILIVAARVFGILARRVGQPAVVGEIFAGLALGPSLFGALFPELHAAVFQPSLEGLPDDVSRAFLPKIFAVLAQLGLIFLLFLIGLEFDFVHVKERAGAAAGIALAGIAVPFGMGLWLAHLVHPMLEVHPEKGIVPLHGFALFLGVAMSVTAIPVLGRIMMDLGITRTRLGSVVIAAAGVNDALGWILLAGVAGAATSGFEPLETLIMLGWTLAFAAGMVLVVRPLLLRGIRYTLKRNDGALDATALTVLFALLLLCAIATNRIGVFAIFGAFLLGVVLSDQRDFHKAVNERLRDVVNAFFLPIFFTYTGLRTDVQSVGGMQMWLICGVVLATAMAGKFIGCGVAARLGGFPRREAAVVGTLMNARGLMELIVINIGYDLGVLPRSMFCMLVIMALATTVMTTPIVLRLSKGTELEEPIRDKWNRKAP